MKLLIKIESQEKIVNIVEKNGSYTVEIDGKKHIVDCRNFGHKDYLSLLIDNRSYLIESAPVKINEGKYYARVMGRHYNLEVLDELLLAAGKASGGGRESGGYVVRSPMPGLIIDVRVKRGDAVRVGSAVVVIEAMKMQNELISEVDGVVKEVRVRPKDTVESQTPLVLIERT